MHGGCLFSLCREENPDYEPDPGVIILFTSPHDVDRVLQLPAAANVVPRVRSGKKHYL